MERFDGRKRKGKIKLQPQKQPNNNGKPLSTFGVQQSTVFVSDKVSCIPGWFRICYTVDGKFLTLLLHLLIAGIISMGCCN